MNNMTGVLSSKFLKVKNMAIETLKDLHEDEQFKNRIIEDIKQSFPEAYNTLDEWWSEYDK